MTDTDPEIDFLRAVEDMFATLRGVPHLLSPKDVQLARTWWKDGVTLPAVTAGVAEAIEKRREADDGDQVVSLSYCRHAVRRHAKRIKEQHVGAHFEEKKSRDTDRMIGELSTDLRHAAERSRFPGTATVIEAFADQVDALQTTSPSLVDEQLFSLESALLDACRRSLPTEIIAEIEKEAESKTANSPSDETALKRSKRAIVDRRIRKLLDLPRLEIL